MPAQLRHFAIHADDVPRAKRFYETAFGWTFTPWGPPGFYQIHEVGLLGALQERREPLSGTGMRGFEVTLGVDDLKATLKAVADAGGALLDGPFTIDGVGDLAFVADTEGNRLGVMQYDNGQPESH